MSLRTETTTAGSLAVTVWPERVSPLVRNLLLVVLGTAFLALSAKIQVPFWPVPMTLTTLAVMLLAAAYGSRLAVITVAAYIAEGLAGVPVFSGPVAGPGYLLGTTAGFIWGYLPAALIIGLAADRGWDRSPARLGIAMLIGDAVIFACGFVWLAFLVAVPERLFSVLGVEAGAHGAGVAFAWANGVQPFLFGDAIKILLAACLIPAGWAVLRRK